MRVENCRVKSLDKEYLILENGVESIHAVRTSNIVVKIGERKVRKSQIRVGDTVDALLSEQVIGENKILFVNKLTIRPTKPEAPSKSTVKSEVSNKRSSKSSGSRSRRDSSLAKDVSTDLNKVPTNKKESADNLSATDNITDNPLDDSDGNSAGEDKRGVLSAAWSTKDAVNDTGGEMSAKSFSSSDVNGAKGDVSATSISSSAGNDTRGDLSATSSTISTENVTSGNLSTTSISDMAENETSGNLPTSISAGNASSDILSSASISGSTGNDARGNLLTNCNTNSSGNDIGNDMSATSSILSAATPSISDVAGNGTRCDMSISISAGNAASDILPSASISGSTENDARGNLLTNCNTNSSGNDIGNDMSAPSSILSAASISSGAGKVTEDMSSIAVSPEDVPGGNLSVKSVSSSAENDTKMVMSSTVSAGSNMDENLSAAINNNFSCNKPFICPSAKDNNQRTENVHAMSTEFNNARMKNPHNDSRGYPSNANKSYGNVTSSNYSATNYSSQYNKSYPPAANTSTNHRSAANIGNSYRSSMTAANSRNSGASAVTPGWSAPTGSAGGYMANRDRNSAARNNGYTADRNRNFGDRGSRLGRIDFSRPPPPLQVRSPFDAKVSFCSSKIDKDMLRNYFENFGKVVDIRGSIRKDQERNSVFITFDSAKVVRERIVGKCHWLNGITLDVGPATCRPEFARPRENDRRDFMRERKDRDRFAVRSKMVSSNNYKSEASSSVKYGDWKKDVVAADVAVKGSTSTTKVNDPRCNDNNRGVQGGDVKMSKTAISLPEGDQMTKDLDIETGAEMLVCSGGEEKSIANDNKITEDGEGATTPDHKEDHMKPIPREADQENGAERECAIKSGHDSTTEQMELDDRSLIANFNPLKEIENPKADLFVNKRGHEDGNFEGADERSAEIFDQTELKATVILASDGIDDDVNTDTTEANLFIPKESVALYVECDEQKDVSVNNFIKNKIQDLKVSNMTTEREIAPGDGCMNQELSDFLGHSAQSVIQVLPDADESREKFRSDLLHPDSEGSNANCDTDTRSSEQTNLISFSSDDKLTKPEDCVENDEEVNLDEMYGGSKIESLIDGIIEGIDGLRYEDHETCVDDEISSPSFNFPHSRQKYSGQKAEIFFPKQEPLPGVGMQEAILNEAKVDVDQNSSDEFFVIPQSAFNVQLENARDDVFELEDSGIEDKNLFKCCAVNQNQSDISGIESRVDTISNDENMYHIQKSGISDCKNGNRCSDQEEERNRSTPDETYTCTSRDQQDETFMCTSGGKIQPCFPGTDNDERREQRTSSFRDSFDSAIELMPINKEYDVKVDTHVSYPVRESQKVCHNKTLAEAEIRLLRELLGATNSQPENSHPDSQPESSHSDSQPENNQPENSQPENSQSENSQPEKSQPENSQPEISQLENCDNQLQLENSHRAVLKQYKEQASQTSQVQEAIGQYEQKASQAQATTNYAGRVHDAVMQQQGKEDVPGVIGKLGDVGANDKFPSENFPERDKEDRQSADDEDSGATTLDPECRKQCMMEILEFAGFTVSRTEQIVAEFLKQN